MLLQPHNLTLISISTSTNYDIKATKVIFMAIKRGDIMTMNLLDNIIIWQFWANCLTGSIGTQ
jgi:hypothetical protein